MKTKKKPQLKKKMSRINRTQGFLPVKEFECEVTGIDGNNVIFTMNGDEVRTDFGEVNKSLSVGTKFLWKIGYYTQPWGQRIKRSFIDIPDLTEAKNERPR